MNGRWSLALVGAAIGCSGLTEAEGGVVGIETGVPGPDTVEVGESIQLSARPLDKNGNTATVPVTWLSADAAASIDASTGVLTGVTPGTARVQATVGALGSELIAFAVVAPADTLVLPGDSSFTVARDLPVLPDLVARLDSRNPAGPAIGRGVIYAITSPDPAAAPPVVLLTGSVSSDTVVTGSDGTAVARLIVLPGATAPDSVVVQVRAERTRGAVVPGSGARFVVRFQP